ncbi:MAG: hypothetical protein ACYDCS_12720 [Candidatus Dormibacteria bacterium]
MKSGSRDTRGTNRLLNALPAAQRVRLGRWLSRVLLDVGTVLFEPDQAIDFVDFPCNCVVSLVTPLQHRATVEVASVGNQGIVGVPVMLGGSLAVRAVCSVAG